MNAETREFIRRHADEDVKALALKAHGTEGVDLRFALDQIAGRQTARQKLPTWAATEGIVYPPHISMEQCSSEATALYKRNLSLTSHPSPPTSMMVDLTGGFGVDFSFLARNFSKATYLERQEHLCDIARENFRLLGLNQAEVVCGEAESFLKTMPHANLIYLDPARRDTAGARTFAISDCTPNVIALRDLLLQKADRIMVKLSPMLDWRKAASDLGERNVSEVHIVSVNNECKELLMILSSDPASSAVSTLHCINIDGDALSALVVPLNGQHLCDKPQPTFRSAAASFLYEPNASIMKAGCFEYLQSQYEGLCKLAPNSHLFVSEHFVESFPGRTFSIVAKTTMNKRELKAALADIRSANIATRNFPLSAAELRKRLKLKDGGDTYVFATTDADNQHRLYICRKTAKKK